MAVTNQQLRLHGISSQEDKLIERWASSCGRIHDCNDCQDNAACQRLGDKLVGKVHLVTESGIRRMRGC